MKNDTASAMMAQPEPTAATTIPAIAEPIVKARLPPTPRIELALCRCSRFTICGVNPVNAGYQMAFNTPNTKPLKASKGTVALPVRNSNALIETKRLPMRSHEPTSRARPKRSATAPPILMNNTSGTMCTPVTMLRELAFPPGKSRTPKASATGAMPFPMLLTMRETRRVRKSRILQSSLSWSRVVSDPSTPEHASVQMLLHLLWHLRL